MKATIGLLAISLAVIGCANSSGCREDLSEAKIAAIVDDYLARNYGMNNRWPDKDVKIRREACDYVYVEHSLTQPVHVGDWFGMTINQDGEVVEFFPGY